MLKENKKSLNKTLKNYMIIKQLGEGSFAKVYQAVDERDKNYVAIKEVPKSYLEETPKLNQLLKTQIQVLRECDNPNVVSFIQSFQTKNTVCIVIQFCNEGDLENYLEKKKTLSENQALSFLKQILNGFKGLHEVGAMHRDFKTANVLLKDGVCKIADLGFAKQMRMSQISKGNKIMVHTVLGTSSTMAPQVLEEKPYSFQADIWSIGVVYYQMLFGRDPYQGKNDYDLLKNIKMNQVKFYGANVSDESKDFIKQCLTVNPQQRINWSKIYCHPLLQKHQNQMIYGTLKSLISLDQNKDFYQKKKLQNLNKKNSITLELIDEKKSEQDLRKTQILYQQARNKMDKSSRFREHQAAYLNARNKCMFIFKFVNPNFLHYSRIKANHSIAMFILSKKAYLDLKELLKNIKDQRNIFNKKKFQDFVTSPVYKQIMMLVEKDMAYVQKQAQHHKKQITLVTEQISDEFQLKKVASSNFQKLVKKITEQYWCRLAEGIGSVRQNKKQYVIRSLEALTFYHDNEKTEVEEFDLMLKTMDLQKKQKQIMKKYSKMI